MCTKGRLTLECKDGEWSTVTEAANVASSLCCFMSTSKSTSAILCKLSCRSLVQVPPSVANDEHLQTIHRID